MGICKISDDAYAVCAMTDSEGSHFYLLHGKTISLLTTSKNESSFTFNISQYVDYNLGQTLTRLYCVGVEYGEGMNKSNTVYIMLNTTSATLYAIQSTDGTTQSFYIDDIDSFSLSMLEKIFLVRDTTGGITTLYKL